MPLGKRRALTLIGRLAAVALLGLVLAELALRWFVLSPSTYGWSLSRALRRPELYGSSRSDDDHWRIQGAGIPAQEAGPNFEYDAQLGWVSRRFAPRTYVHDDESLLDGRRPLLMLGDSYVQCVTSDAECFEPLFAESELASDYLLLNYGVGGWGFDQVHLLLQRLLERDSLRVPIVVIGVLVGDDFDRCSLGFRGAAKPRFELRDGVLELKGSPVPTFEEQAEASWPLTSPLLWKIARAQWMSSRIGTSSVERREREKEALARALVRATLDALDSHGVQGLFLLFYDRSTVAAPDLSDWRERVLRDELTARHVPFVDVGAAMRERAGSSTSMLDGWFVEDGGHFNAEGNRIACEAMIEGLRAAYGLRGRGPLPRPERMASVVTPDPRSLARFAWTLQPPFTDPRDACRLSLRVGPSGPTEVTYDLDGLAEAFVAEAHLGPSEKRGSVRLEIRADDELLFEREFRDDSERVELRVDLRGRRSMHVRVDDAGDGARGDWLILAAPRFLPAQLRD